MNEVDQPTLIAIAGGIGSGKSVVCHILEAMGYAVYDCDSRAKQIMDSDRSMKLRIAEEVCADAIQMQDTDNPVIDRKILAKTVFGNDCARMKLNAIVHEAVKCDIRFWATLHSEGKNSARPLFIETAILRESGLDKMVDEVWVVTAPAEIRIMRAMQRDNASRSDIEARVHAQNPHSVPLQQATADGNCSPRLEEIRNDGNTSVLSRILTLLDRTR